MAHFLHAMKVRNVELKCCDQAASRKFPMAWRSGSRWKQALGKCEPAMQSLVDLLSACGDRCEGRNMKSIAGDQWLADASAWLLNTVAHVARDAWLHPKVP